MKKVELPPGHNQSQHQDDRNKPGKTKRTNFLRRMVYRFHEKRIFADTLRAHSELSECSSSVIPTPETDRLEKEKREVSGRSIYLIGEMHLSILPAQYFHNELLELVIQDPKSWLFLIEGAFVPIVSPASCPARYYLEKTAALLDIPVMEALTDIYDKETRDYIKRESGLFDSDVDRFITSAFLAALSEKEKIDVVKGVLDVLAGRGGASEAARELLIEALSLAKCLEKPFEVALELISSYAAEVLMYDKTKRKTFFDHTVGIHWNNHSRLRFHRILEYNPDKRNILVNVGLNHLPAFDD